MRDVPQTILPNALAQEPGEAYIVLLDIDCGAAEPLKICNNFRFSELLPQSSMPREPRTICVSHSLNRISCIVRELCVYARARPLVMAKCIEYITDRPDPLLDDLIARANILKELLTITLP